MLSIKMITKENTKKKREEKKKRGNDWRSRSNSSSKKSTKIRFLKQAMKSLAAKFAKKHYKIIRCLSQLEIRTELVTSSVAAQYTTIVYSQLFRSKWEKEL
jgi:hypothetical protein